MTIFESASCNFITRSCGVSIDFSLFNVVRLLINYLLLFTFLSFNAIHEWFSVVVVVNI